MRAAAVVLAAFSGCLMVYSIYCKSKEDMLGVQAAGSAFALAASLLSGCWVAVILSALAIVRNLWTAGKPRKYFVVAAWVAAAVVTVLWEKAGIFPLAASFSYSIAASKWEFGATKAAMAFSSVLWTVYNFQEGLYPLVVSGCVAVVAVLTGVKGGDGRLFSMKPHKSRKSSEQEV